MNWGYVEELAVDPPASPTSCAQQEIERSMPTSDCNLCGCNCDFPGGCGEHQHQGHLCGEHQHQGHLCGEHQHQGHLCAVDMKLESRRRWLCGVVGFCFPKTRLRRTWLLHLDVAWAKDLALEYRCLSLRHCHRACAATWEGVRGPD
eukprot:s2693_g5.t1